MSDRRGLKIMAIILLVLMFPVVLAIPPIGAVVSEVAPYARRAGPAAVVTSFGVGLTNAIAEEVFWRALPVAMFPDDPVRGWLWPTAGFTAWHLVPLRAAHADAARAARLLFGAAVRDTAGWRSRPTRW